MQQQEAEFERYWPNCMATVIASRTAIPQSIIQLDAIGQSMFHGDGRPTAKVYPADAGKVDWVAATTQAANYVTKNMTPICRIRASTKFHVKGPPSMILQSSKLAVSLCQHGFMRPSGVASRAVVQCTDVKLFQRKV